MQFVAVYLAAVDTHFEDFAFWIATVVFEILSYLVCHLELIEFEFSFEDDRHESMYACFV